eukprot:7109639-Prymnesium_polylepis.1
MMCGSQPTVRLKVFDVGGRPDRTPPKMGEVTLKHQSGSTVEVNFEGFIDDETAIVSMELMVSMVAG